MRQAVHRGSTLEYLTVCPDDYEDGTPTPLIFCLHGYGANMRDLAGLAPAIDPNGYVYVLPNGPMAAPDLNDPSARAWHERGGSESPEAVRKATAALGGVVQEVLLRYRVPAGRAVLLGFSQGGAMALRYGLPRPSLFAGLAILSGALRQLDSLRPSLPTERTQPIFLAHGTTDTVVSFETSQQAIAFLEAERYQPEFHSYPIGHEITLPEVRDLREWIHRTLPPGSG